MDWLTISTAYNGYRGTKYSPSELKRMYGNSSGKVRKAVDDIVSGVSEVKIIIMKGGKVVDR